MIRRRTIIALSAVAVLALGVLIGGGAIAFTRTEFGRARIRALVLTELRRAIHGRVYIGRVSGNFFTTVTLDSLEIRDPDGYLFVAAGRVTATYDPRDIVARKIALRNVAMEHPVLQLIRHRNGVWNLKRLFPPSRPLVPLDRLPSPVRQLPREATRGFGDYIVVDTVTLHDGTVSYSMPWDPDDTVRRAQRDSEINVALHDPRQGVSWWPEGLMRTLRWQHVGFASPHVRIVDPDSAGVAFGITHFAADESDPPFKFRNVRGRARIVGDSAFLDLPHLELPGSIASGGGKLWWGPSRPLSASLHFVVDSVSLADIAWVYPTLPASGGGRGVFDMQSDRNPHITAYALSALDIRTTGSHVHGALTFVVGRPTLAIRNVAVRVDPLDMVFIRTLTGKPFPVDWAGQFTGFARGPGGPLPHFRVDTTDLFFRDAHVPGAISHAAGSGELNVTDPSETVFHHFRLTLHQLDLRTPEFVLPKLGSLRGTVSGTATLDSVWDNVTIRGADLVHHDGDGEATRLLGGGHITLGSPATTYDLDLRADPLSFSTLARSYPQLWLRGSVAGPLTMHGTLDALNVTAALTGDAGTLRVQGHANTQGPLYSARGTLALDDADLRALTGRAGAPTGPLTARATLDLEGDSIGDLAGSAVAELERSLVDGFRVVAAQVTLRFVGGEMLVDSLDADWALGSLRVVGGLGLVAAVSDTLRLAAALDSLGGLRRFLAADSSQPDSLTGTLRVAATLSGSIDSLAAAGSIVGGDMRVGGARVRSVGASFALGDIPDDPQGTAAVNLDGLALWGVALDHIGATAQLEGDGRTLVGLGVAAPVTEAVTGGAGAHGAAAIERRPAAGRDRRVGGHVRAVYRGQHVASLRATRAAAHRHRGNRDRSADAAGIRQRLDRHPRHDPHRGIVARPRGRRQHPRRGLRDFRRVPDPPRRAGLTRLDHDRAALRPDHAPRGLARSSGLRRRPARRHSPRRRLRRPESRPRRVRAAPSGHHAARRRVRPGRSGAPERPRAGDGQRRVARQHPRGQHGLRHAGHAVPEPGGSQGGAARERRHGRHDPAPHVHRRRARRQRRSRHSAARRPATRDHGRPGALGRQPRHPHAVGIHGHGRPARPGRRRRLAHLRRSERPAFRADAARVRLPRAARAAAGRHRGVDDEPAAPDRPRECLAAHGGRARRSRDDLPPRRAPEAGDQPR